MQRDGEAIKEGDYFKQTFIIESAKEGQAVAGWAPDSSELPETHEHCVRHYQEERNGRTLSLVDIGVREKAVQPSQAADNLNTIDESSLELAAVKAGVPNIEEWRKLKKPAKIKAIRDAKK